MKILVLTKNMSDYRGAYYQEDFLRELSVQAECDFYGPGFSEFSPKKNLTEILRDAQFAPDFILTSHSFLEDNPQKPLESFPGLQLNGSPIPVVSILNKEYSRLTEKVRYFSAIGAKALFTHHHNLVGLTGTLVMPHFFLPFAVDPDRFPFFEGTRRFDLGFAGILQNPFVRDKQPDTRVQLMKEIYVSAFDTPLWKKPKYARNKIIWRSWTGNRFVDQIGKALGHGKLSDSDYASALRSSKVWVNSPSPLGIISTRYFECMATGTLVLAQKSTALETVLPPRLMSTFVAASDLPAILASILSDPARLEKVTHEARDFVLRNHTWRRRVSAMLMSIAEVL